MKRKIEPIYSLKTKVFLTEEDAWEAFTKWRGYDVNNEYFLINTKDWWDVYILY